MNHMPLDATWATTNVNHELSYGYVEYMKLKLKELIDRYKDIRVGEIRKDVIENSIKHIMNIFDFKYEFRIIPNKKRGIKISMWLGCATWDWQCPTCGHIYTIMSGYPPPRCWHGYGKLMDTLSEKADYYKHKGG